MSPTPLERRAAVPTASPPEAALGLALGGGVFLFVNDVEVLSDHVRLEGSLSRNLRHSGAAEVEVLNALEGGKHTGGSL